LFGHVRGAYTGAVDTKAGQFETASGGTIFLDEIGEMSPRLQAKLLHVLQEKLLRRVGGRDPIRVDARIIAATNQNLDRAIGTGGFRSDLYFRLCVICLRVPPLRERKADIERLARHFARRYAALYNKPAFGRIEDRIVSAIMKHPFEGNVRELENLIKRGILLGSYDVILNEIAVRFDVARAFRAVGGEAPIEADRGVQPLKEVTRHAIEEAERTAILGALTVTRWNRRRAARLLRVSYRSLLYKITDYAINPSGPEAHPMADARKGTC
jgi:two-component system response regulator AtoC